MTTSESEWQRLVKRVKTSGTTSDNEWQRVVISVDFSVFRIREEPTTKHPKENFLNLKEDLEERLLNYKQKQAKQELQKQLFAGFL